mmetsp:Transcript_119799/g.233181  ORF Transcript_119799/g.233181 Transcript_119799/m.233181 type:complete len:95 (-) Transcript_119799:15-299(-)
MPFGAALEAELLLALGATYGSKCLFFWVEFREHPVLRGFGRRGRQHAVEDDEDAASSPRAVHHRSRRMQQHRLLVPYPGGLRQQLRHVQVDGVT